MGRTLAGMMELPRDLVLDVPRISILGQEEVRLENHKGIIEYGSHCIRISISRGYLEIYGDGLEIAVLRPEEMLIVGRIGELRFVE